MEEASSTPHFLIYLSLKKVKIILFLVAEVIVVFYVLCTHYIALWLENEH